MPGPGVIDEPPNATDDPKNVISSYDEILQNIFNGDASKVVIGMCSMAEPGTCTECNKPPSLMCNNGSDRAKNIASLLVKKYKNFGGIMQWASKGDTNSSFSDPMLKYMNML